MRKITKDIIEAFENGINYKLGNSEVCTLPGGSDVKMYLHGHLIAKKDINGLSITNCGYFTNVTKERLNGISGVSISQEKGVWYLNGKTWDGEWINI